MGGSGKSRGGARLVQGREASRRRPPKEDFLSHVGVGKGEESGRAEGTACAKALRRTNTFSPVPDW